MQQGQPIYYTGSHSGTEGSFEQGRQDAKTDVPTGQLPW
jgi:hypothetical protein